MISRCADGRTATATLLDACEFDVVNPRDPEAESDEQPAPEPIWTVADASPSSRIER